MKKKTEGGGKRAKPKVKASQAKRTFTWGYVKPQLKARARTDAKFRKLLIESPGKAFKQLFGYDLPRGVKLHTVSESPKDLYVVVPKLTRAIEESDLVVAEARDWQMVLNEGEDCPGQGNPTPPPFVPPGPDDPGI